MVPGLISVIVLLASLWQQAPTPPSAQPQFRITGTIVSALDGRPISRGEVHISQARTQDDGQSCLTGDDGRFEFDHVPPGKYMLTAGRRGFLPQAYLQHGAHATAIVAGPGLDSENIVFRMFPDASISGQITNEINDPVRDSQVLLFSHSADDGKQEIVQREQAPTDDLGQYHFNHLEPGTYFLAISAQPWYVQYGRRNQSGRTGEGARDGSNGDEEAGLDVAYPLTFYPNATDSSGAEAIILNPSDNVEADIHLLPVPAVHIHVKDPGAGEPPGFTGFEVSASRTIFGNFKINVPLTISSFAPGSLELEGLSPGPYELQYTSRSRMGFRSKTEELNISGDVEMDVDEDMSGSRIGGVVKIEGSSTIPSGVFVTLQNVETGDGQTVQSSAGGKFEFEHRLFTEGRFQVSAGSSSDFILRTLSAAGAKVSGENIEVNGTDNVRLTVVLSRAVPAVDGIALRDTKPVAGAMIVLVPQDPANNQSLFRLDQTDSDGSFSLENVVPGTYTVVALDDAWNLEWANPAVIGKYLPGGVPVQAGTEGKYNLRVSVQ
jgi:hypothetical protein